jgi:hypothetical protein
VSDRPRSYGIDGLQPVPRAVLGDKYPQDETLRDQIKLVVE